MSKMLNVSAKLHLSGVSFQKVFFLKSLCLFQHSKATLIKAWLTYFSSVVFPQRAFVHKESDSRSKSNSVASDSTQRIINKMLRLTPQTSKSLYFTKIGSHYTVDFYSEQHTFVHALFCIQFKLPPCTATSVYVPGAE